MMTSPLEASSPDIHTTLAGEVPQILGLYNSRMFKNSETIESVMQQVDHKRNAVQERLRKELGIAYDEAHNFENVQVEDFTAFAVKCKLFAEKCIADFAKQWQVSQKAERVAFEGIILAARKAHEEVTANLQHLYESQLEDMRMEGIANAEFSEHKTVIGRSEFNWDQPIDSPTAYARDVDSPIDNGFSFRGRSGRAGNEPSPLNQTFEQSEPQPADEVGREAWDGQDQARARGGTRRFSLSSSESEEETTPPKGAEPRGTSNFVTQMLNYETGLLKRPFRVEQEDGLNSRQAMGGPDSERLAKLCRQKDETIVRLQDELNRLCSSPITNERGSSAHGIRDEDEQEDISWRDHSDNSSSTSSHRLSKATGSDVASNAPEGGVKEILTNVKKTLQGMSQGCAARITRATEKLAAIAHEQMEARTERDRLHSKLEETWSDLEGIHRTSGNIPPQEIRNRTQHTILQLGGFQERDQHLPHDEDEAKKTSEYFRQYERDLETLAATMEDIQGRIMEPDDAAETATATVALNTELMGMGLSGSMASMLRTTQSRASVSPVSPNTASPRSDLFRGPVSSEDSANDGQEEDQATEGDRETVWGWILNMLVLFLEPWGVLAQYLVAFACFMRQLLAQGKIYLCSGKQQASLPRLPRAIPADSAKLLLMQLLVILTFDVYVSSYRQRNIWMEANGVTRKYLLKTMSTRESILPGFDPNLSIYMDLLYRWPLGIVLVLAEYVRRAWIWARAVMQAMQKENLARPFPFLG